MPTTIPQPIAVWEKNNALTDSVGGNTLTNSSGSYTTGKLGGATGARSSSANRDTTAAAICNLATETHSFSMWFYWDFTGGDGYLINYQLHKASGAGNAFAFFGFSNDAPNALTLNYSNQNLDVTASAILNGWNHLIYSRDKVGNSFKVYLNGTQVVSTTDPGNAGSGSATRFRIQALVFTLKDDQSAIWDVALTDAQMLAVHNSQSGIEWANPWVSPYSAGGGAGAIQQRKRLLLLEGQSA